LDSAIYYSAWNQCIAEAMKRFPVDLYHINDYHGTVAPLYLLPDVIPCALSLHNAEFQGLWPMREASETKEVCSAFHLDEEVVKEYVQFGEVFNLLHGAASYLRIHQKVCYPSLLSIYGETRRRFPRCQQYEMKSKSQLLATCQRTLVAIVLKAIWDYGHAERKMSLKLDLEYGEALSFTI
jgi:glycogen synthase